MLQRYNFFLINKYKNELKSSFFIMFRAFYARKKPLAAAFSVLSFQLPHTDKQQNYKCNPPAPHLKILPT